MRELVGKNNLPEEYNKRLDNYRRDGMSRHDTYSNGKEPLSK